MARKPQVPAAPDVPATPQLPTEPVAPVTAATPTEPVAPTVPGIKAAADALAKIEGNKLKVKHKKSGKTFEVSKSYYERNRSVLECL